MFTNVAETEIEDGVLSIGYDKRSPMAIFSGPGGLETVIRFDRVVVTKTTLDFFLEPRTRGGAERETGAMEAGDEVTPLFTDAPKQTELEYTVEVDR